MDDHRILQTFYSTRVIQPTDIQGSGDPYEDDNASGSTEAYSAVPVDNNPFQLSTSDWAYDKEVLRQVQSGESTYAFFVLNRDRAPVVSWTRPANYRPKWKKEFLRDMKGLDHGYCLCYSPKGVIPALITWTLNQSNNDDRTSESATFVKFNQVLGLGNWELETINGPESLQQFLDRYYSS